MVGNESWLAVDWGTSHLRVWAMTADHRMLAQTQSDQGGGKLQSDDFEPALLSLIQDWLAPVISSKTPNQPVKVVICGMAGAKQGWREAPYQQIPRAGITEAELVRVPTNDHRIEVYILPGLCQRNPADVMRGEETQIAGYMADRPDFTGAICLPGTHTKWVSINDGEIMGFQTFMTGELYDLVCHQSILKRSCVSLESSTNSSVVNGLPMSVPEGNTEDQHWDQQSFFGGFKEALEAPEGLFAKLFSIRAKSLLEDLKPAMARSRLSGLLIGMELAGSQEYWEDHEVVIIGSEQLSKLYKSALDLICDKVQQANSETLTLKGLSSAFDRLS